MRTLENVSNAEHGTANKEASGRQAPTSTELLLESSHVRARKSRALITKLAPVMAGARGTAGACVHYCTAALGIGRASKLIIF